MFLGFLTYSVVLEFVTVLMLNSFDFWIVKNLTGRKLIGLRWWTYSDLNVDDMVKEESEGDFSEIDAQKIEDRIKSKRDRNKLVSRQSSDSESEISST